MECSDIVAFSNGNSNISEDGKYLTKNYWEVSCFFGTKIRSVNVSKFCERFHVVLTYYSSSHQLDKLEGRSTGSRDDYQGMNAHELFVVKKKHRERIP